MGFFSWLSRFRTSPAERAARDAEALARTAEAQRRAFVAEQRVARSKRRESAHATAMESFFYGGAYNDYLAPLIDRLNEMLRDPTFFPWTGTQAHKYGGKWPIFQSEQELNLQRTISRAVYDANNHGKGLIGGVCAYVVGKGHTGRMTTKSKDPGVKKLVQFAQDWYDKWEKANRFKERQQEAFQRGEVDGEFFWRLFPQSNGMLLIRWVWPEHVVQPPDESYSDEVSYGIFNDPDDIETTTGYWVAPNGNSVGGEFVDAHSMIHVRRNVWTGVKRGLPGLILDLRDLLEGARKVRRNTADGAAVQASIAFIRQHEQANASAVADMIDDEEDYTQPRYTQTGDTTRSLQTRESGQIVDIDGGQTYIQPPGAENSGAYIEVMQACLRNAGVRYNAPEWLTSGDSSNANYSSSLVAENPFVRNCEQMQDIYGWGFQAVVHTAIRHAVSMGRLPREVLKYVEFQLEPPSLVVRDKGMEAQMNSVYMQAKIKSPQTIQQELGLDTENEKTNWDAWQKMQGPEGGPQGQPQPGGDAGGAPDPFDQNQDGVVDQDEAGGAGDEGGTGGGGGGGPQPPEPADTGGPHGFTGIVRDKRGRTYHYMNGRRIAGEQGPTQLLAPVYMTAAVLEQALMESGFTGVVTDRLGREYHYVDGVRTKTPEKASGFHQRQADRKASRGGEEAFLPYEKGEENGDRHATNMRSMLKRIQDGEYHPDDVKEDLQNHYLPRAVGSEKANFAAFTKHLEDRVEKKYGSEALHSREMKDLQDAIAAVQDQVIEHLHDMASVVHAAAYRLGYDKPIQPGKGDYESLKESQRAHQRAHTQGMDKIMAAWDALVAKWGKKPAVTEQFTEQALEQFIFEAGFTGTKQVTVKGKPQTWYYENGKRVPNPNAKNPTPRVKGKAKPDAAKPAGDADVPDPNEPTPKPFPAKPDPKKAAPLADSRPSVDDTVAKIDALMGDFSLDKLEELANQLQGHTLAELAAIKKRAGGAASDAHAEFGRRIAERAKAETEVAGEEKPEPAPAPEKKKKKYRKSPAAVKAGATLWSQVLAAGGIKPPHDDYNVKETFHEHGLLGLLRKNGRNLDELAEELEAAGHIKTPPERHPGDWLIEKLQEGGYSLVDGVDQHIAAKQAEYDQELADAREYAAANPESGITDDDLAKALREGTEAGLAQADEGNPREQYESLGEHAAEGDGSGEAGDASGEGDVGDFDFGANEDPADNANPADEELDPTPDDAGEPTDPKLKAHQEAEAAAIAAHGTTTGPEAEDTYKNAYLASLNAGKSEPTPSETPSHPHAEALAAIPAGGSGWVAGHRVSRDKDGNYRLETDKHHVTGTGEEIAARIERNWSDQKPERSAAEAALARADAHEEPDPFHPDYHNTAIALHRKRKAIPKGARVVSLDENTRGRLGSVSHDESGRVVVKADGSPDVTITDFEPLDEKHSWRGGKESSAPKPEQPKQQSLLADVPEPEPTKPDPNAALREAALAAHRGELLTGRQKEALGANGTAGLVWRDPGTGEQLTGTGEKTRKYGGPAETFTKADGSKVTLAPHEVERLELAGRGENKSDAPAEPPQTEQEAKKRGWKNNGDGTYTAPNGAVWKKAAAGGETSPVTGEFYKGGRLMPVHGQSKKQSGKGDGTGEAPGYKPTEREEPENRSKKDKKPRRPQRTRNRMGDLVEVPEGHIAIETLVAGAPEKTGMLNDTALAYLGLTKKQARDLKEIHEANDGAPYIPREIVPPSSVTRGVAPDDSWDIMAKWKEYQQKKGEEARAKDAERAKKASEDDAALQKPTTDKPTPPVLSQAEVSRDSGKWETASTHKTKGEALAAAPSGGAVVKIGKQWHALRPFAAPTAPTPTANPKNESSSRPSVSLSDPTALADAVHEASGQLRDVYGQQHGTSADGNSTHKVLIGELYDTLKSQGKLGDATLDDFKAALVNAHRAGALSLTRLDLPNVFDNQPSRKGENTRSEASYMNATWHMVAVPRGKVGKSESTEPSQQSKKGSLLGDRGEKTDIDWKRTDDNRWSGDFSVDGHNYNFSAQHRSFDGNWQVRFTKDLGGGETTEKQTPTSTRTAMNVFGAVGKALEKFIGESKPDKFLFTADSNEPSRVKLYDRLSKMIAEKMGYDVERQEGNFVGYQFTKKKA